MQAAEELDPHQILLNVTSFRRKFHIYEVTAPFDQNVDSVVYVVRKQVLNRGSNLVMKEVDASEKHTEIQVSRDDVRDIFDMVRNLSIPGNRTGHAGRDDGWYGLRIGFQPCSTTIRWWSDKEPELQQVYNLRDKIVNTVNRVIRIGKDSERS